MAVKTKKAETLTVKLETKPGSLAQICGALRESGVNVISCWAYEMGPGEAQAHFYAADTKKAKDVLNKMGRKPEMGKICFAEGEDTLGCYSDLLTKISKAGVNLHATDAFGIGGKFGAAFFCDDKDFPALCKALGC